MIKFRRPHCNQKLGVPDDYAVFYFPFDFSWIMKRAFKRLNLAMILLMELEVWPNLASLATVVFVGRSLVPMGGSDMMEPTALGKCTLFGPHTFNFRQTVEVLLNGRGAIEISDEADLFDKTLQCLINTDFASRVAQNGQTVIRQNQGATQKTLTAIQQLLKNK